MDMKKRESKKENIRKKGKQGREGEKVEEREEELDMDRNGRK
jgi:hypothetical protein